MIKLAKLSGILSIIFGSIATILSFIYTPSFALFAGLPGFLFGTIYSFLNSRYQLNPKFLNAGNIGLMLSSVPVIYIFILLIIAKNN